MPAEMTVVTLVDDRTQKKMKLQGTWTEDSVQLLLNDNQNTWTAEFKETDVSDSFLSQLEVTRKEYVKIMKGALGSTCTDGKYRYRLEEDALTWYRNISPDVRQSQGLIPLVPMKLYNQGPLIHSLLITCSNLLDEVFQCKSLCQSYQKELENANVTLDKCAKIKNELERNLYTKFALLLNEKKEYVRRMTGGEVEEDFGPGPPSDSDSDEQETKMSITSVTLSEFSKRMKNDQKAGNEQPFKKLALDPGPSSSTVHIPSIDMDSDD